MKVVADQIALFYPDKVGQLAEQLAVLQSQGVYIHHTEVERQYEILGQLDQVVQVSRIDSVVTVVTTLPPVIEQAAHVEPISPTLVTTLPLKKAGKRKQEQKEDTNKSLQKQFNLFLGRLTTGFHPRLYQGFSQTQFNKHRHRNWRNATPEQVEEVIENAKWLTKIAERFVAAHGSISLAKFDMLMVNWIGCHPFQFESGNITQYDKKAKKFVTTSNDIYRKKAEAALNP